VKDLAAKFTEVERRVRRLVDENGRLRGRVRELEQLLADARRDAEDLETLQGRRAQVREKLARVLKMLEKIGIAEQDRDAGAEKG
jgi:chromosome segregation ATPase